MIVWKIIIFLGANLLLGFRKGTLLSTENAAEETVIIFWIFLTLSSYFLILSGSIMDGDSVISIPSQELFFTVFV